MQTLKRARFLLILGLGLMLLGALDPLEGSVVIAAGSIIAAWGGWLGPGRGRTLHYWAAAMIVAGVALMFGWTAIGGFGGETGWSIWWGLTLLPYPIGWVLGLVAAVRMLRRRPEQLAHA
jgi:hypothetical protein